MPSAFDLLNLSPALDIDDQELREAFQKASSQHHPDQGGSTERFEAINQAHRQLKNRPTRVIALLNHFDVEFDSRGSLSPLLDTLFQEVANTIQDATPLLQKKEDASSPLASALLEAPILKLQQRISEQIQELNQVETSIWNEITSHEELEVEKLQETARSLTFIYKWKAQLQSCFARCW